MSGMAVSLALALLAGFLLGLGWFAWLWLSVRTLTETGGWGAFAAGGIVRLAAVAAVLAAVLRLETGPVLILAGLPGFLAARLAVTAPGRSGAQSGNR